MISKSHRVTKLETYPLPIHPLFMQKIIYLFSYKFSF